MRMKKSNKKKLTKLIRDLNMSITPKEVEEYLKYLDEEEAGLLVKKYAAIKKYRDILEKYASVVSPEEYKKARDEFNKKLAELKAKYIDDIERIQQKEDAQMDEIERDYSQKLDDQSQKTEKNIGIILEVAKKFHEKLMSLVSKN